MNFLDKLLNEENASYVAQSLWHSETGSPARAAYRAPLACWLLRIYAGAGGMPPYDEPGSGRQGVIAQITGVAQLADQKASAADVSQAIKDAFELMQAITDPSQTSMPAADCTMLRTINWLAASAGLNLVERDIFELGVALRCFIPLRQALNVWGNLTRDDFLQALSALLAWPSEAVARACQSESNLLRCGLIRLNDHEGPLGTLLKAPRQLSARIPYHQGEPQGILAHLVQPMPVPGLQLSDFKHIQADTRLAQCWLAGALAAASHAERAGHLLVSGAPGLGKTEWVRALLLDSRIDAMELTVLGDDGTALSGYERLEHLRLAISLLRRTPHTVLLFDEADDVFRQRESTVGNSDAVSMSNHRASLNRLLDDSQLPVIWIMNDPHVLDAAVLRRFDAVIPFEGVPRSVRLALLSRRGHWKDADIQRWANIPDLTPALIDRLATVQERATQAGEVMDAALCGHWLRQRLPGKATRALGQTGLQAGQQAEQDNPWSAQAVHASEDLLTLAEGIKRCGRARVLLYGPPGSGKTAYAHALAQMLDKTLMEQRASDLLSPYVGETEQRISLAFETALNEGALLFIDEADSLLLPRERAVRNWEVSQVNELLESLGEFEGLVVLATNRLDALEGAVLRRLDAKIEFKALTAEQAGQSFIRLCEQLAMTYRDCEVQEVAQLVSLTPGDFACVRRRLAFAPLRVGQQRADEQSSGQSQSQNPSQTLVALLKEEVRLKTQGRQPIGFNA